MLDSIDPIRVLLFGKIVIDVGIASIIEAIDDILD
jgi:hypothetical protein